MLYSPRTHPGGPISWYHLWSQLWLLTQQNSTTVWRRGWTCDGHVIKASAHHQSVTLPRKNGSLFHHNPNTPSPHTPFTPSPYTFTTHLHHTPHYTLHHTHPSPPSPHTFTTPPLHTSTHPHYTPSPVGLPFSADQRAGGMQSLDRRGHSHAVKGARRGRGMERERERGEEVIHTLLVQRPHATSHLGSYSAHKGQALH